jgi:antitoxin HicB
MVPAVPGSGPSRVTPGLLLLSQSRQEEHVSEYSYTVLFEPAEEGGYVGFCPALPGLVTEGDTFEEARDRVKEAIEGYLESLLKDGEPIPPDKPMPALKPAIVRRAFQRAGLYIHHVKGSHPSISRH